MNSSDRSAANPAGPRFARLLIDHRAFEVSVSVPDRSRSEDLSPYPILVDVNNETRRLEGRRVCYLTMVDTDNSKSEIGGQGLAQVMALADFGATASLTAREREVLTELAKGASNTAIARTLGISVGTVRVHVKSVLRKLTLDNRVQAAVWATAMAAQEKG